MGLIDDLPAGRIAVDTAPFIYLIEQHERFGPIVMPLFEAAETGARSLVVSALTLLEVLVVPYRSGDLALAERYEQVLTRSRGLEMVELDRAVLRAAAQLRAIHGLRTPDAIQMAVALSRRCSVFVTNDRRLPPVPGLDIVQVSAFAA